MRSVVVFVFVVGSALACSQSSTPSPACTADGDCAAGQSCVSGACAVSTACADAGCPCQSRADCPSGMRCNGGACAAAACQDAGCSCVADGDCLSGLRCLSATCGAPPPCRDLGCSCHSNANCAGGLTCLDQKCATPPLACTDTGCACRNGSGCNVGLSCVSGHCVTNAACTDVGCACQDDRGCNAGLVCNGGQCAQAPACTTAGCACQDDSGCTGGLSCVVNACAAPAPAPDAGAPAPDAGGFAPDAGGPTGPTSMTVGDATTSSATWVSVSNAVVVAEYHYVSGTATIGTFYLQGEGPVGPGLAVYHGAHDTTAYPVIGDVVTVSGSLGRYDGSLQLSTSTRSRHTLAVTVTGHNGVVSGGAYAPAGSPVAGLQTGDYAPTAADHHDAQVGNVLQFDGPLHVTTASALVETGLDGGTKPRGFAVTGGLLVDDSQVYYNCLKTLDGGVASLDLPNGITGVWDRYQNYNAGTAQHPAPTVPVLTPMKCTDIGR